MPIPFCVCIFAKIRPAGKKKTLPAIATHKNPGRRR
jgi:hypothetical protein